MNKLMFIISLVTITIFVSGFVFATCENADINMDGKIDANDYDVIDKWFLFQDDWGGCSADTNWCNNSDINKDGKVGSIDNIILDQCYSDKNTIDLISLNQRVEWLENVINALFKYFPDFKIYFYSPQQCNNGEVRCMDTSIQKCVNYDWVNQVVCQYGCTNGVCNDPPVTKEDCTQKGIPFCRNSLGDIYSIKRDYLCASGKGTNTQCKKGYCKRQTSETWTLCLSGCNSATGKCN